MMKNSITSHKLGTSKNIQVFVVGKIHKGILDANTLQVYYDVTRANEHYDDLLGDDYNEENDSVFIEECTLPR